MKRLNVLFMLFSVFNTSQSYAQKSWCFGFGVATSIVGQKSTNEIVDRYNETRPWLDKKMSKPNPFGGYVYSFAVDKGDYSFQLGVNLQKSILKASGTAPSGIYGERQLMIKNSFWSFNGLWDFGSMWGESYGLGVNLGGAFGGGDYYTKITGEDEFRKIRNTGYDGAGLFLGIFYEPYLLGHEEQGISFRITPYMRGLPGSKLNVDDTKELLAELDPVNAQTIGVETSTNNHIAFGVSAELIFRLER